MTLLSAQNLNVTIECSDSTDAVSARLHYLHPDFDDDTVTIYSKTRCPLAMLAETCNNIGKVAPEMSVSNSQESSLPISPSCSSSCSAPKFSPQSSEFSPVEKSKPSDEIVKEKSLSSVKNDKRKRRKKDTGTEIEKRICSETPILNSPYSVSEFLKINNSIQNTIRPDTVNLMNAVPNNLLAQNRISALNSPSIWKMKNRVPLFQTVPPNYSHPNIPLPAAVAGLPRMPVAMMADLGQLYSHLQGNCECFICTNRKMIDKSLGKPDPTIISNAFPFLKPPTDASLMPSSVVAQTIKYCMYCGYFNPILHNLISHMNSEHSDILSSNAFSKVDSFGNTLSQTLSADNSNLSFKDINMTELQNLKSREFLKQLHFLFNSDTSQSG